MLNVRRPKGRLFRWLFSVLWACSAAMAPHATAADGQARTRTALQTVDKTVDSNGQEVTRGGQPGTYPPKAENGGGTPGMAAVKWSDDYRWSATPSADLSTPGVKTVTLKSCPPGVLGKDTAYYATGANNGAAAFPVYISGTGIPEAVMITGGTCKGDGNSGTLQFTTVNAHSAGYKITSATDGIYEAHIAARINFPIGNWVFNRPENGYVQVSPGYHILRSPLNIVTPGLTIDFSGSVISCAFDKDCINITYSALSDTLIDPKGQSTTDWGTHAFIVDYGQGTRIVNVKATYSVGNKSPDSGRFGYGVVNVADQAMLLDGMNFDRLTCGPTFCGAAVYAPGPFTGSDPNWNVGNYWGRHPDNAAVGYIKNLNLSLNCQGNGVDWQSGNTVRVSDSVIQGYPQFGVRNGLNRGGYGMMQIDNLYEEIGVCSNPIGNIGQAGLIVMGGKVKLSGGESPAGSIPSFGGSGSTTGLYYVIFHDPKYGSSNAFYAGSAKVGAAQNLTITFPDLPSGASADSFDLLRVAWSSGQTWTGPYGTGNYAVVTRVIRASACTQGVCKVNDTQVALGSYTVPNPTYYPGLKFWPGGILLGPTGSGQNLASMGSLTIDQNDLNNVPINGNSAVGPTVTSSNDVSMAAGFIILQGKCQQWRGSPAAVRCFANAGTNNVATLVPNKVGGASDATHLKGRVNLGTSGTGPTHIITLVDSNPAKTMATAGNRPANDANDAYIGKDTNSRDLTTTGIAVGAPVSISNYIGNVGDGTNWKERLTAGLKSFTVNLQAPVINATRGFQVNGKYGIANQCLVSTGTAMGWGSCWGGPAQVVADNFNRGDNGSLGSNWTGIDGSPSTVSNQAARGTAGADNKSAAVWTGRTSANDQYAQATVVTNTYYTGPMVRGSNTALTGYVGSANGTISYIKRCVNGNCPVICTGPPFSNGDTARLEAQGTTLTLFKNGVSVCRVTDRQIPSGYAGLIFESNNAAQYLGNWEAGDLTGTTSPLITKGDLYVYGRGNARLPVGADGQCLMADSTSPLGVRWGTCGGGRNASATATELGNLDVQRNWPMDGRFSKGGPYLAMSDPPVPGIVPTTGKSTITSPVIATPRDFVQEANACKYLTTSDAINSPQALTQNRAVLWAIGIPCILNTSKVSYYVQTADTTGNSYDIGLYDAAGNLKAHTGAIAGSTSMTSGWHTNVSWIASTTLAPGRYHIAITTNCPSSCAVVGGGYKVTVMAANASRSNTTSGGLLDSGPITIEADSASYAIVPALILQ